METLDFEELKRRAEKLPEASPQLISNHLYLHAYFNHYVSYSQRKLPDEFHQTAGEVEKIVRDAFPLNVIALETVLPMPKEPSGNISRYCGLVNAISKGGREATVILGAHHISYSTGDGGGGYEPACMNFEAHLPVDGYLENTKNALTKLWPLIRGIEFATPRIPKGMKPENFQSGSVLLVRNNQAIATGHPCFRELGLNLKEKDISLVGGWGI